VGKFQPEVTRIFLIVVYRQQIQERLLSRQVRVDHDDGDGFRAGLDLFSPHLAEIARIGQNLEAERSHFRDSMASLPKDWH